MPVPPKVRSFWWRVVKKFVPSRTILKERHMDQMERCEVCGAERETIHHALFQCTWAKLVWRELRYAANLKIPDFHPDSWAMDIVDSSTMKEDEAAIILCSCWAIWNERNARRHGEGGRSVTDSVRWALEVSFDLSNSGRERNKKAPKTKVRWKLPDDGVIKINTDASFLERTMTGSSGLVVRDHTGALLRAQALWYDNAANVQLMEAIALRDGVRLAVERGYQRVIFETDSLIVVKLCEEEENNRSELMSICQEIRELSRAFSSFSLKHIGRDANLAAHLCAKQASADRRRCLWINYNPGFLSNTLLNDCNPV
jgi:ribonuclease HI